MNEHQQFVSAQLGRQIAAFNERIEREQAHSLEEFKRQAVAPLPPRWGKKALAEYGRRTKSTGDVAANRWLLNIRLP